jgi:hypothetical protein
MIDFRPVTIADRDEVNKRLALSDFRAAEYSFANLFNWSGIFHTEIAFWDNLLLFRSGIDRSHYFYPAGTGPVQAAVQWMMDDAAAQHKPFTLRSVQEAGKQQLEQLFPGRFTYTAVRDLFDYVYLAEDLLHLSGKKLQPKRNHISRFKKTFDWQYEDLTEANLAECKAMNEEWCRLYGCLDNASLKMEGCAVCRALNHFTEEGLLGGALRVDGKIIAFTAGEQVNADTLLVHIEKAFGEAYPGAYQVINQEFVRRHAAHLRYVNREDDAGDEGLRKAKLSYRPAFLLEKYIVEVCL